MVVDCHNDLIMLVTHHRELGRTDYMAEHGIPELRRGGVDVQVMPIFVDDAYRPEGALRRSLLMIEYLHEEVAKNSSDLALCVDGVEIDKAVAEGKIALVLALEGCEQIGTDLELFDVYFKLGVRMASFTHFGRTMLAEGSAEEATGSRLTRAGVEAVGRMETMGMVVDVSHLSQASTAHVLEIATRPLVASHSNARSLRDHHRNIPDDQLKAIAALDGVIGANFFPLFVHDEVPGVDRLVDHIEHVASVAGIDHVGLGPDFMKELADALWPNEQIIMEGLDVKSVIHGHAGSSSDLPLVTDALVERGFSDDDIKKILGENFMRVFRAVMTKPQPI